MEDTAVVLLDFRAILEAAPDGVAIVDSQGRILVVNKQFCSLFGYPDSELAGTRVEALVPSSVRDRHVEHREHYQANPSRRPMGLGMDLVGLQKDGTEFPIEVSLSPVSSGGHTFTIAFVRDISDRWLLRAEQAALRTDLDTEREGVRIGRDLHDGIMQDIYAVTLGLDLVSEDIEQDPKQAEDGVARSIDQLHGVIRDIRSLIFDLRPRQFSGDVRKALQDLGREFQENSTIPTEVQVAHNLPEIPQDLSVALYVITHEALSNTRKHAQPSSVQIALYAGDGVLCLDVRDDGRGFDTSTVAAEGHRGLRNITNRADTAGAEVRIQSAPGEGTVVHVTCRLA